MLQGIATGNGRVFCHADGLLFPRRVVVTPDGISAFIRRVFGVVAVLYYSIIRIIHNKRVVLAL